MKSLHIHEVSSDAESDRLSELVDGEAKGYQREELIKHVCHDPRERERWALYHLIGDAMRDNAMLSPDFNQKFSERLAAEPTVLAPRLRRYMAPAAMAMAASVAVVSVIALMPGHNNSGLQLAGKQTPKQTMEVQMAPYLVAHQEFSPVAVASPYQRTVLTLDVPAK